MINVKKLRLFYYLFIVNHSQIEEKNHNIKIIKSEMFSWPLEEELFLDLTVWLLYPYISFQILRSIYNHSVVSKNSRFHYLNKIL